MGQQLLEHDGGVERIWLTSRHARSWLRGQTLFTLSTMSMPIFFFTTTLNFLIKNRNGQKNGSSNLCRENSIPDTAMRGVVRAFLVVALGLCSVAEAIPAKRSRHLQGEVSSCRLICARRSRRAKENLSSQKQKVLSHLDLKCVSEYGSGDLHDGRRLLSSHRHPPSLTLPA